MNETRSGKKEKCQHIQVFVRVRPINNVEKNNKSTTIIEIPNDKEVIIHERPHEKFTKKFKFDNVFGPYSKQIDVYNVVVSPLLDQVLAGYNCTVFAYGQTGTGKTFTMEGINTDPTLHWQSDSLAGIIPRSLSHLFDQLHLMEAQEYTIRVSFLELYNEDLFDLLSPNDDGSKIRLYEDTSKKGAIIIHGLEEVTIHNKSEVYKILEKGSEKRQTAATLMNTQSSRSHTVFSITVHMKENTIDGEEVLKTGKLNLVDLAGSENVGRSGAVDRRAREAGNINQSLLTLGRVITALVERAPHIPYRESKLTRLLQESLGGRTKTSIIATVSPASINLEETLSTLDYAHRAKNITNRPEINQKLSKKEFLKQYTEEIKRLQRDLLATRERNGVYLADDNYNEMQSLISQQTKEIEEKINHIKVLEKTMQDKEKIFSELELQNIAQMKELHETKIKLNNATDALISTKNKLKTTTQERNEQKYLVEKYMHTEQTLLSQAQTLLSIADTATADSYKLHDKIERKTETEKKFEVLGEQFKNNLSECLQHIQKDIKIYGASLKNFDCSMKNGLDKQTFIKCEGLDKAAREISNNFSHQRLFDNNNLAKCINEAYLYYESWIENELKNAVSTIGSEDELLRIIFTKMTQNIDNIIENEIAKNLKTLRCEVFQKLNKTSSVMKDIVDSVCTSELEAYNNMNKNVKEIMKDIEVLRKKQKFSEKQLLFSKMMEDVYSQFKVLSKSQRDLYCDVTNKCANVTKICNEINDHTTNGYNKNVTINYNLKEQIERDMKIIETNVTHGTMQSEDLVLKNADQERVLINELTSNINESCDVLRQYKNRIECNIKEMQPKMCTDGKNAILLLDSAHEAILDVSKSHSEFMQEKKIETFQNSEEVAKKLVLQIGKSREWSEDVDEKLQRTINEINEFFDKDIQRDVPTGSTPARKEFSYPRQFKVTSPHERILQRFREARKFVDAVEEDEANTSTEVTMKQIANSTALPDVTLVPSSLDNTAFVISTLSNDVVSKHTNSRQFMDFDTEGISQISDISSITVYPHIQSDNEIYTKSEDKENGNNDILTHDKARNLQPSRLQKPKRKVLGMYN